MNIKKTFRKHGCVFLLIQQGPIALLYEQRFDRKIIGYEVHKIRVRKFRILGGVALNETQRLPSDEDFGKWAWSHQSFARAMERFRCANRPTTKKAA
jgi:hypothetical protein